MGEIVYPELSKIHDPKVSRKSQGSTYVAFLPFESYAGMTKYHVSSSVYEEKGCCTTTAYSTRNPNTSTGKERMVMRFDALEFPSKYRNKAFINSWIKFINTTFPWGNVKLVAMNDGKLIDPKYWGEKNISFHLSSNCIYISYEKVYTEAGYNGYYQNLLTLSLIITIKKT
jgi:hypothetical protein